MKHVNQKQPLVIFKFLGKSFFFVPTYNQFESEKSNFERSVAPSVVK